MSLFSRWHDAMAARDVEAAAACLHDDYTFIRHQAGTTMSRDDMLGMLKGMFANAGVVRHSHECVYENAEVLVERTVVDFPDGSRESVLSFTSLKAGLMFESQTGATPLPRD